MATKKKTEKQGMLEAAAEAALLKDVKRIIKKDVLQNELFERAAGERWKELVWDLTVRRKLPLGELQVADVLCDVVRAPEQILWLLENVREEVDSWGDDTIPGVSNRLHTMIDESYAHDPKAWDAHVSALPQEVRRAFDLVRAEHGVPIPDDTREALLAWLDERALGGGFDGYARNLVKKLGLDERSFAARIIGRAREMTGLHAETLRVLSPLMTFAELADRVVASGFEPGWLFQRLENPVWELFHARQDSGAELASLAERLAGKHAHVVNALIVLAGQRGGAPASVLAHLDPALLPFHGEKLEQVVRALASYPADALTTVIRQRRGGVQIAGALGDRIDAATAKHLVGVVVDATRGTGVHVREAFQVGLLGPAILPHVEQALAATDDAHDRIPLRKVACTALLARGDAPSEAEQDRWLTPQDGDATVSNFETFTSDGVLGRLLVRIDDARARAIVARWCKHPRLREAIESQLEWVKRSDLLAAEPPLHVRIAIAARESGLPCDTKFYVVDREGDCGEDVVHRFGGDPTGLAPSRRPTHGKKKMRHVLTLDVDAIPELRARKHLARTRALALFATEDDRHFDVVHLTEREATAPFSAGAETFVLHAVMVPRATFGDDDETLATLRALVARADARVLGAPRFVQEEVGDPSSFVLQAEASWLRMNLGDVGRLFMFEDEAFAQSH